MARAAGESVRCIARRLGRSPSTVSRELARNADRRGEYRATTAHAQAWERACRPKPAKLIVNGRLREIVQRDLERKYSPEQIAGRLRLAFPDDPEMWVSAETIDQPLYVTSRGALRRELTKCLRTGRSLRKPGPRAAARNRAPDMINIAQRPQEADDRAVPGRWEGDLLIGKANRSAIGTLVERTTGYALLIALPDGYKPEQVAEALAAKIQTLPEEPAPLVDLGPGARDARLEADPRRYRDRGVLLRSALAVAAGTNENTNGLLRQYFPKGTDLSTLTDADLDRVADELNDRPRKRLGFYKPSERIAELCGLRGGSSW